MVDKMTIGDITGVNELGSMLNPKFEKLFHIESLNDNEIIYVYRDNDFVIGFIHISVNFEVADLLNIVVDKDYQNKGIGSILMDYMISGIPSSVRRILLEVDKDNIKALKLYSRFNFEIISERKNYYGQKSAYVMEKRL